MTLDAKTKAHRAALAALEKQAADVVILNVGDLTTIADFFVICSGDSQRQVTAISECIDEALAREGVEPFHVEGLDHALWVLMDYRSLIVHIFKPEVRQFYDLERLWGDAPKIPLPTVSPPKAVLPKAVLKDRRPSRRS